MTLSSTREDHIGVGLYIDGEDAKAHFHLLGTDRSKIGAELGYDLEWLELPDRTACRIIRYWNGVDPLDEGRWPEYRTWMIESLDVLIAFFETVYAN